MTQSHDDNSIPHGKRLIPYPEITAPGGHYRELARVSTPYPSHLPRAHHVALHLELPAQSDSVFAWPADPQAARDNLVVLKTWLHAFSQQEHRALGVRYMNTHAAQLALYTNITMTEELIGKVIAAIDHGRHPSEMLPLGVTVPLNCLRFTDHETAHGEVLGLCKAIERLRKCPEPAGIPPAMLRGVQEFKHALLYTWLPQAQEAGKREKRLAEQIDEQIQAAQPSEETLFANPAIKRQLEQIGRRTSSKPNDPQR